MNPVDTLAAYGLEDAHVQPIVVGNINLTYAITSGTARHILQRLNPIFSPEVHNDIEALTAHLTKRGMATPRLVRNQAGRLWTVDSAGFAWRLMTFIDGKNHNRAPAAGVCRAAGELLGRFHVALSDANHTFSARRIGVHDTPKHVANLEDALSAHRGHGAFPRVEPLAKETIRGLGGLDLEPDLPLRTVHGDPKLNNIMFDEHDRGICFIDLDTLAPMPIPVELGDAFRSWCNLAGEDDPEPEFSLAYFDEGLRGYAQEAGALLTPAEVQAIVPSVLRITLELAARFLADALQESYFGWNQDRYSAAWEHNLVRGAGQVHLARSIEAQRRELEACVVELFA